jgi:hypothetical protein
MLRLVAFFRQYGYLPVAQETEIKRERMLFLYEDIGLNTSAFLGNWLGLCESSKKAVFDHLLINLSMNGTSICLDEFEKLASQRNLEQ